MVLTNNLQRVQVQIRAVGEKSKSFMIYNSNVTEVFEELKKLDEIRKEAEKIALTSISMEKEIVEPEIKWIGVDFGVGADKSIELKSQVEDDVSSKLI